MKTVKLTDYERGLEKRKADAGLSGRDYVTANSGVSRTPEKRALLRALGENAKAEGKKPQFKAKY